MIKILLLILLLIPSAAHAIDWCADANVVGCYKMKTDPSPSTTLTDDASNHNGTLDSDNNPDWTTDAPSSPTAYDNGSFDFTSDTISIADHTDFESGTGASGTFTLTAWIYADTIPTADGSRQWIFTKGNGGGGSNAYEWALYTIGDGAKAIAACSKWEKGGVAQMEIEGTTEITTGTWFHVACTLDVTNEELTLYVNASQDGQDTTRTAGTDTAGNSPVEIGSRADGAATAWDGHITEVAYFNDEKTGANITDIYNEGLGGDQGGSSTAFTLNNVQFNNVLLQ